MPHLLTSKCYSFRPDQSIIFNLARATKNCSSKFFRFKWPSDEGKAALEITPMAASGERLVRLSKSFEPNDSRSPADLVEGTTILDQFISFLLGYDAGFGFGVSDAFVSTHNEISF